VCFGLLERSPFPPSSEGADLNPMPSTLWSPLGGPGRDPQTAPADALHALPAQGPSGCYRPSPLPPPSLLDQVLGENGGVVIFFYTTPEASPCPRPATTEMGGTRHGLSWNLGSSR
jgi:hypothetical protein